MLTVKTITRIRPKHLGKGVPSKQIARELGLSRNTVRKAVRNGETSFRYERRVQPMPKLAPWMEELERRLGANKGEKKRDRLSMLRTFEALAQLGYCGGYDAVRRYAMGWWLTPAVPGGPGFEVSLDATRSESASGDGQPGHGVGLRMTARW